MKYLAIGPGALGMFSLLGALHKIKDKLIDVEEISGASAGSLLGFFLSLNKETDEILDFLLSIDIHKYYKFKLKNIINNFGFIHFPDCKSVYTDWLGFDPKFKDLKKKFYVAVFNVNYEKTEYFSVDTHPDMSVIDAIMISMSIPFLFTSVKINGMRYIDGGVYEKIPLTPFYGKKKEDILGIELDFSTYVNREINSIKDYLKFLYSKSMNSCSHGHSLSLFNISTIQQVEGINLLDFKMSNDDKMKLFFSGYKQMA